MHKTDNHEPATGAGLSNLRRLTYFAAVVETGSFTAAAERLGITKAVVSQQVARLEREFRTTLLVRTTREVRTTEAGKSFYQRLTQPREIEGLPFVANTALREHLRWRFSKNEIERQTVNMHASIFE